MDHVDRPAIGTQRLQRSPPEQSEPPGIVGVVAVSVAVETDPVECRRMVDQAQSIAIGSDINDGHG
ncbi:MAG: hypothetical protein WKF78_00825 [Candidatus Limnocylindrales bacterium]